MNMGAFLSYSIMSGIAMLALYLAYRSLLAMDKQHGFNRAVLLLIYVVSFAASPFALGWADGAGNAGPQAVALPGVPIAGAAVSGRTAPAWGMVLIWVYMAGMAAVAVRTAVTWWRLIGVIGSGTKVRRAGYTLVVTESGRYAPFSWMNYVVISRDDYENNCPAISAHELKHVTCRHWVDLLIAQIVCIVNWFNPAAWLMRDELMLVHEYQADMAVIDGGHNPQEYQMLLIKKAVGARFPSLANSLNHSKLKKRITMMYKEKSGAGRKLKALALAPTLALALGVAGVPAVRAAVSTIGSSEITTDKDSEKRSPGNDAAQIYRVTGVNYDGKRTTVVISGENLGSSLLVSGSTLTNDGNTYQSNSLQMSRTDTLAVITASFPFSGEYKNPRMTLNVNGEEITFNLDDALKGSLSGVVASSAGASAGSSVIVLNGSSSFVSSGSSAASNVMDVYLDGNRISASRLDALPSDSVASITVDKRNNVIRIQTK